MYSLNPRWGSYQWSWSKRWCRRWSNYNVRKTTYSLKTPHVIFPSFIFGRSIMTMLSEFNGSSQCWPHDLDLWPMTLTYKADLNILPLDLHAKKSSPYVCPFGRESGNRHTHTDRRQTHDVKTITPDTSLLWGELILTECSGRWRCWSRTWSWRGHWSSCNKINTIGNYLIHICKVCI